MKGYNKHWTILILLNCLNIKICFCVFCLRKSPIFESQRDYDDQILDFLVQKTFSPNNFWSKTIHTVFISYPNNIMSKIFVPHEKKKDSIENLFLFRENKIQNKTIHKFEKNCKSPF